MRASSLAFLVFLAGCPGQETIEGQCKVDSDCGGGAVCARTEECLPASQVRQVTVTWTIRGMPASAQTCATSADLFINFYSQLRPTHGYAPVPCMAGQFSIDKLPRDYDQVELGVEGQWSDQAVISAAGTASLNLSP